VPAAGRCKVVLASGNPHKLEELRRTWPTLELELLDRDDPPLEDGASYVDNARIKAEWGRRHAPADAWVVGEDSGIEAVALGDDWKREHSHRARAARELAILLAP